MMTNVFEERTLRLYSKDTETKVCDALEQVFELWIKRHMGGASELSMTPFKQRQMRGPEDDPDGDPPAVRELQCQGLGCVIIVR